MLDLGRKREYFIPKIPSLHRTNTLDMRSITRCLCSYVAWTIALSRAHRARRSGGGNCLKMATPKRARRAEGFQSNLLCGVRFKAEKIRRKIAEKLDGSKNFTTFRPKLCYINKKASWYLGTSIQNIILLLIWKPSVKNNLNFDIKISNRRSV